MRIPVLIVLAAGLGLAACDRADPPPPVPAAAPGAETPAAEDDARGVTMRYDCGEGYRVAILGDSARVTTADGTRFELPRMPDTAPPVYAGEAMELAIGSEDAQLGRADGGDLTCTPA
jgi:hypothetical protein